ncbi:MAG: endonuclease/exonuclease/phosphatase family protein [Pirellulales bacterium]
MTVRNICRSWLALTWLAVMLGGMAVGAESTAVRVMSFNVRYGTADDKENHWDHRQQLLIDTIRAFDPDILGTQETLGFQRDYIAEKLPDYQVLGVGRDDGAEKGEMMALYYRRDRFEQLDAGHFWLSETPEQVGSKSWDSSLPRMATWVKLRDRRAPDSRPILAINTHFDHQGTEARLQSARLLRSQASKLGADADWIITGDFNTGPGSEPYEALFGPLDGNPSPVVDSYRELHASDPAGTAEGTFTGFDRTSTRGPRIDWIAVSRGWKIESAAIDRTEREGHLPSDHFPVTAVISR